MREKICLDERWLFHRGDIERKRPSVKGPIYTGAKTVRERWGAASPDYNDDPDCYKAGVEFSSDRWDWVNLPHDFVIEGEFDRTENNALGYLKYDNAWYRRHFRLEEADKDKRITLYFEGVSGQSSIYVNGCHLHHNFCGYTSFEVDITDFAIFGGDNVIAVYIDSSHHESWWYEGGGIYRHVWLIKTAPVCVDLWGVFVKPEKQNDAVWKLNIDVDLKNTSSRPAQTELRVKILDEDNHTVAVSSSFGYIPPRSDLTFRPEASVCRPHLWQVGKGYLYTANVTVIADGETVDEVNQKFGFRTVVCDPQKGLFVNGEHVKIKGVCGHYDCGLTGKAVSDNVFRYKVKMMQDMGANGYRTSHYPQSEALMDALDEAGFIVLDETRWFSSSKEGMEQLEMLIRRDRSRPSVFFWCIGNEEPLFAEERGYRIVESLLARTRQLDPTRPVTAACDRPDTATVYKNLDIIGINYGLASYDAVHEKYPERPVMSTECCATGTTRGWYDEDFPAGGYITAYDRDTNHWFRGRENTWRFITDREWVMGSYQWIAFEHRGETFWPRLCSQSGAIDLFLQKKDAFYQNKSHWTDEPMIHLLPHWNHSGHEGETIRISAYTNCDAAELYVNGVSAGKADVEKYSHAEWRAEYVPGKIEVIGYRNGEEVCRDSHETTGRPAALRLVCENADDVRANGADTAIFSCWTVDDMGREVPTACPTVSFHTNLAGSIIGTGSDVSDHVPLASPVRKMRAGRMGIAVKCGKNPGILKLYAEADGLDACRCEVELK